MVLGVGRRVSCFRCSGYWSLTSGPLPVIRILWRDLRGLRFVPVDGSLATTVSKANAVFGMGVVPVLKVDRR